MSNCSHALCKMLLESRPRRVIVGLRRLAESLVVLLDAMWLSLDCSGTNIDVWTSYIGCQCW